MRGLGGQRLAGGLGQAGHHGRLHQTGGDRDHADLRGGELAGRGQGQRDHGALGGGVRDLADLPVVGRHGRGVHDDAAVLAERLLRPHRGGGLGHHRHGADRVDRQDPAQHLGGQRPVATHELARRRHAGAVDQHPQRPGLQRGGHGLPGGVLGGDVARHEARMGAEGGHGVRADGLALAVRQVHHHDGGARVRQAAGGGMAEARGPAGDDRALVRQVHGRTLPSSSGYPPSSIVACPTFSS